MDMASLNLKAAQVKFMIWWKELQWQFRRGKKKAYFVFQFFPKMHLKVHFGYWAHAVALLSD